MRARNLVLTLVAGAFLPLAASADPAVPPLPGQQPPVVLTSPPGVAPITPTAPPTTVMPPAAATTQHVRGTIQSFDGPFLTLKLADKTIVTLGMTTATRLVHEKLLGLAGLQVGAYVSVAALKSADDKQLRAQGVRVLSANLRGSGEGQYPIDAAGTRLLTNGAITAFTPSSNGGTLSLSFHGASGANPCTGHAAPGGFGCNGASDFVVARGVPIIGIEAADVSLLLQGATVSASVAPDANGTLVAVSVTVEKGPPPPKGH